MTTERRRGGHELEACLLCALSRLPQAVLSFSHAVSLDAAFKEGWANMGTAYKDKGDTSKALQSLGKVRLRVCLLSPHTASLAGSLARSRLCTRPLRAFSGASLRG